MPAFKNLLKVTVFILLIAFVGSCNFPPLQEAKDLSVRQPATYEVSKVFTDFYTSVKDAENVIGEPVSHAFVNPANGNLTQYFENMRLETTLDEYNRMTVVLSNLGKQLFSPDGKSYVSIDQDCITYDNAAYPVCHEFRKFYEAHDGEAFFGNPLSHVFEINNRYYQYFDNGCLIWDPFATAKNTITMAPLGETYLESREPMRYTITQGTQPELMIVERQKENDLNVQYSVEHPFISPNWDQAVTISVRNQNNNPMPEAIITVSVTLPNGHYEMYRPSDTNEQGITTFTIPALAAQGVAHNDIIELQIEVETDDGQYAYISGWFRIWL